MEVRGIKHSSFCLTTDDGRVIYIDPWQLPAHKVKADIILISHIHHDHCSPADVAALCRGETRVVCSPLVATTLRQEKVVAAEAIREVEAGQAQTVGGVKVEAVHAYNVNKFRSPGQPFHPFDPNFLGFVLTVGGQRLYFAGDTDVVPPEVGRVDVAMLPVSGTYVMTPEEAAAAARQLQPGLAIPMHYGSVVAGRAEAERFRDLAAPVPVAIHY